MDGRREYVLLAAREFAPAGFDAALLTAGGDLAGSLVQCIRTGGRIAYLNVIFSAPETRTDVRMLSYNGDPDSKIVQRLNNRINSGKLKVHISEVFSLEDASKAHLALEKHYLGKICLKGI